MVCASVREIIHSLKLVDYLPVQTDKHFNDFNMLFSVKLAKIFELPAVFSAKKAYFLQKKQ